jgi:hypothetical protein
LPTTSAYTDCSFLSRWIVTLNLSASSACSIWGTCSLVPPSGSLAMMSNRCALSQLGPET